MEDPEQEILIEAKSLLGATRKTSVSSKLPQRNLKFCGDTKENKVPMQTLKTPHKEKDPKEL